MSKSDTNEFFVFRSRLFGEIGKALFGGLAALIFDNSSSFLNGVVYVPMPAPTFLTSFCGGVLIYANFLMMSFGVSVTFYLNVSIILGLKPGIF